MRFAGQWCDHDTGLHYNRFRYYDPQIGRFISPDPLGAAGSFHPYLYAGNAPDQLGDPLGLAESVFSTMQGEDFEGVSGRSNQQTMAPEVRQLIQDSGQTVGDPVGQGWNHQVGDCAEVDAASQLAMDRRVAEDRPGGPDPNRPLTPEEMRSALRDEVTNIENNQDGQPIACCPSCRRMLTTAGVDVDTVAENG
jgi:RHS repeat-associated protein